jgi:two-component system nitrate/nitrite response regulator NarL
MHALNAGACGFLGQDILGERLIKSLELIEVGETVVHPQFSWAQMAIGQIEANGELEDNGALQAKNGKSYLTRQRSSSLVPGVAMEPSSEIPAGDVVRGMSRREMLILRTLMEGASNKAIARKLVITESTVKVHMKAILRKLRLQNRTQAAIWARNHVGEEEWHCPTVAPGLARVTS